VNCGARPLHQRMGKPPPHMTLVRSACFPALVLNLWWQFF